MSYRPLVRLLLAVLIAGVWFVRRDNAGQGNVTGTPATVPAPAAPPAPTHAAVGFRDRAHRGEHFPKHGAGFGASSESEYLRPAQTLRDRPARREVPETVRTFFRPNDGERCYTRQLARGRSEP